MTALRYALFNFVTETRLCIFVLKLFQRSFYRSFLFCTLQFDIMNVFASALVSASADFAEFKDETEKSTIPMMWTRQITTQTRRMLPR